MNNPSKDEKYDDNYDDDADDEDEDDGDGGLDVVDGVDDDEEEGDEIWKSVDFVGLVSLGKGFVC